MNKLTIAVIFGGVSSEHEVSRKSVMTIIDNIDRSKYDVHLIGITKLGKWSLYEGDTSLIPSGEWEYSPQRYRAIISPDSEDHGILVLRYDCIQHIRIDVAFPVLHGKHGEDGTIQGLLEIAGIPYVGCGVFASAAGMDKAYTKIIVEKIGGIRQAAYVLTDTHEKNDAYVNEAEQKLGYPMFVKPCMAGSSQGVSRVTSRQELTDAVHAALQHDSKVLIEEAINGRELETAVLKTDKITVSGVGEILAADEFYSYDAKYFNSDSKVSLNPTLPDGAAEKIRTDAEKIFTALGCEGLARVDFFLERETGEVVFNEINTMPGFTPISMYPMLMEQLGFSRTELIDLLITYGMKRSLL